MGTINSSDRIAVTLFLSDMDCLRNICINTLHKGDSICTVNNNNNNKDFTNVTTGRKIEAGGPRVG
jgi:hypothetical protein